MMLKCLNCGNEQFDEDLILINQEHLCHMCTNHLRNLEINKCYNMDCQEGLKLLKTDSVDLIVTDPPYGIYFMSKEWDKAVPSLQIWKQCFRVLKSGAFMFAMCIPRMDCQLEMLKRLQQAGFNIDFTPIYWVYASGFPKAMNVSKKIDEFFGAERNKIEPTGSMHKDKNVFGDYSGLQDSNVPQTQQAKQLDGSYTGFQPKPAVEIIIVAMKPLNQDNYVQQVLHNRKGVVWFDDCRIPFENKQIDSEVCPSLRQSEAEEISLFGINKIKPKDYEEGKLTFKGDGTGQNYFAQYIVDKRGRFPSNLLVSDDVLNDGRVIKEEIGRANRTPVDKSFGLFNLPAQVTEFGGKDIGSFSRYFSLDNWWQERIQKLPDEVKKVFPFLIVPKAGKGERNEGLDEFEEKQIEGVGKNAYLGMNSAGIRNTRTRNTHPTVKPLDLMSYLVILGTRDNDLILDPFIGSGTTAIACRLLNRNFIGFEINQEYHKIAEARLSEYQKQKKLFEVI